MHTQLFIYAFVSVGINHKSHKFTKNVSRNELSREPNPNASNICWQSNSGALNGPQIQEPHQIIGKDQQSKYKCKIDTSRQLGKLSKIPEEQIKFNRKTQRRVSQQSQQQQKRQLQQSAHQAKKFGNIQTKVEG